MKIEEYRRNVSFPLRQATLCFIVRKDEILLAMKKRGFGKGRWNGVGGKVEKNEEVPSAVVREAKEEIGVLPIDIYRVAVLNFYFTHNQDWNQQVIVYISDRWDGKPVESEEMKPKWFKQNNLPYKEMWPDDILWLPHVLNGSFVEAEFMFGEGDVVLDHTIQALASL